MRIRHPLVHHAIGSRGALRLANMYPIWSPRDGAELRSLADEFPVEVGQSPVLALIVEGEFGA